MLHEKIVAAATRQLAIIVNSTKLVDQLGTNVPVPVEVVAFGLEATQAALEVLGASARLRLSTPGRPFVTDSGNRILDCKFDRITDPARLEERIRRIVGVVDSGLFISRADPVFVADASGVRRLNSARSHRGTPPILVMMGVSGSGKTTVAKELAARLGWAFEEGDSLHPALNIAKMHAGIPLTDEDRLPWLEHVAAWIDAQRAKKQPGIITCSALKRSYRRIIIGDRPEVRLVYLRGGKDLIADHLAGRHGHFMPSSLLRESDRHARRAGPKRGPADRRRRRASGANPRSNRRGDHPFARRFRNSHAQCGAHRIGRPEARSGIVRRSTQYRRAASERFLPTGSVKQKTAPRGSFGSAQSRPPCASTIERQIDNPIPKPLDLVV